MKKEVKIQREQKALIKDLELQIDYLIGYAPQGNHWKQEYYIRKTLLDNALESEETPQEIKEKIWRIQNSIFELQNKDTHQQGYLDYSTDDYKKKHKVKVNDNQNNEFYEIEI